MPRFNVSNVIFAIDGAYKYYKYIKTYVLRCTTIGFKQKYGHSDGVLTDMNMMNLRCKSVFTEIGQYWAVESYVTDHEIVLFDTIPVKKMT